MKNDLTRLLWALKGGAIINLGLLAFTYSLSSDSMNPAVVWPARIFFAASAYRCLLPNRYVGNVVLHDTVLSSTLLTRILATFSEVVYIYLFAYVIWTLNVSQIGWVDVFATWMVVQVVISQGCVWWAILRDEPRYFYYEELGWWLIFALNALASGYLCSTAEVPSSQMLLLQFNLVFAVGYLPWQVIHLWTLWKDARSAAGETKAQAPRDLKSGFRAALFERQPTTSSDAWGGWVGIVWMSSYWALLIPPWIGLIVEVLGESRGW